MGRALAARPRAGGRDLRPRRQRPPAAAVPHRPRARRADARGRRPTVSASSIAALRGDAACPSTLYGVFKLANEGTAAGYFADFGVASIGLRPHTIYGPGRDQGLTSAPTAAMVAAARGEDYEI